MRLALCFCLAIVAVPLVQLIPLPPWIWTALPNREPSAEAFEILNRAVPWMPISVSPQATWLSVLSLIPPLAIFLGTLLLAYRERRWLSLVVLTVGVLSALVGLLQVAQGEQSSLRFYGIGGVEAVGFFANRNHFAALSYCLMVLAFGWILYGIRQIKMPGIRGEWKDRLDLASIITIVGGFTVLVILLAGELAARSRAGIGLTMLAILGAFALGLSDRKAGSGTLLFNKLLFSVITVVVIFSLQFALYRIMERIPDVLSDDRPILAGTTIEAAVAYSPFGSGVGTFVPVYAMFEKLEHVAGTYVNRAANDLLELWVETGVLGIALIVLFVIWLARRAAVVWRSAPNAMSQLDWSLARAATIVPGLLIVHSLVDFPLRTNAIMAIMAFACALLIEPRAGSEFREAAEAEAAPRRKRHHDQRALKPALSLAKPAFKSHPAKTLDAAAT